MAETLSRVFFQRDPVVCARELVGMHFRWHGCSGIVVETEAYSSDGDEACHSFMRPSARDFMDRHEAGTAYVYLNYGVHWLTNILIKDGPAHGFVLLRALEPLSGISGMKSRRNKSKLQDLCSGPGKLSRALGIDGRHHGCSLVQSSDRAFAPPPSGSPLPDVTADVRIGISNATHLPWRFLALDSPFVSAKPKRAQATAAKSSTRR